MVIENCWCVRENENINLIESKDLYILQLELMLKMHQSY